MALPNGSIAERAEAERAQFERAESERAESGPTWKVSLALLACIMSASTTLHVLLDDLGWWFLTLLICLVVLGTAALTRVWISHRAVPPLVAAFALFGLLTQQFAPQTTFAGLIPTWETWGRFGELIDVGQASINEQHVPATAGPGILFLLSAGIGLIALASDLVAISFRARAVVGLPLIAILWISLLAVQRELDLFWMIATALSYLYLLRAGAPIANGRLSMVIASGAIVTALVAQAVLPSTVAVSAGGPGTSIGMNASPVVNLGNNLRRDLETLALTYSTESGSPQYLKLVSLEEFDGQKWLEGDVPFAPGNEPRTFGDPVGLSEDIERSNEATWVTIAGLGTMWLPLPYPTSGVSGLGGDWSWDAQSLSLRSSLSVASGQQYRVTSLLLEPTPEQLLAAGSFVPDEVAHLAGIQQEDVPPIIEATALAVVGDAGSHYEMALALQQYLRFGDFVYSEDAPVEEGYDGTGLDVIATFLEVQSGYCVHFASAMALMARTLGIPARVAVGFLPGARLDERVDGRAVYEVTSHDLHAWPELYFEGVGWLAFEPTAGRGAVPDYADSRAEGVPIPGAGVPDPTTGPTDAAGERPVDLGGNASSSATDTSAGPPGEFWVIVFALGLLLASGPALLRAIERRSRIRAIRRGFAPATVGWKELVQSAEDVGLAVPSTITPRESGRLLSQAMGEGSESNAALLRIVSRLEREGYARADGGGGLSADDVTAVIRRLRKSVGWWTRLRATLFPASLWRRATQAIRRLDAA